MLNGGGYTCVEGRSIWLISSLSYQIYCEPRTALKKLITNLTGNIYSMPGSYHPYLQMKKLVPGFITPLATHYLSSFQTDSLGEAHLKSENQGLISTD